MHLVIIPIQLKFATDSFWVGANRPYRMCRILFSIWYHVVGKADIELDRALQRGEFCYVLDSRQMGKSSLLVQTAK